MKKNRKFIVRLLLVLPTNLGRDVIAKFCVNSKKLSIPMLCVRTLSLIMLLVATTEVSYSESHPSIKEILLSQSTNDIFSTPELPSVQTVRNNDRHMLQGIRVGVYQTRSEIEEISIKLRQLGFETKIKQLKRGYILSAGAFSSELNFKRALDRLQKAGLGDKVSVVKIARKQANINVPVKPKKIRSTVFTPHVPDSSHKKLRDDYVPKKEYVKLEHEVHTLKAQMQLLLEKLALTEQDLNTEQQLKVQEQAKTKTEAKKPESQKLVKSSQTEENKPNIVKPKKNNEGIEGDKEVTREDEAKEAKRGLDTFLRGKKVLYKPGELELEFNLAYDQGTTVNTFGFPPDTNDLRTTPKLTTRFVDASFTMRYGIIDDLEFRLTVPYGYFEQNNDNQPFNVTTPPVSHTNVIGVGDIGGSLSYNALSESGNIPTVTLGLSGQAPTGNYNRGLGTGFWGIGGSVSLVKTIDPVVFFGSLGYSAAFEARGVDPSGQISYSMGAGYSMNDRVSFSTSLSGNLTGRMEANGMDLPGTSMDAHSLQFSTTIQLSKRLFVEPFVGFGLTKDASDFAVGLRFPYRFGEKFPLPFLSD